MRWIDRGPEPAAVKRYDRRFTQRWVAFARGGIGDRPKDSNWREFRSELGKRSSDNCWYCERRCAADAEDTGESPTVDHFRPLSRFPELAYCWSNWVFSCQRCNGGYKKDKWPESGYVDPGAADESERPERYFDFDTVTGEIIPRPGLPREARCQAQQTIDDLGLNKRDLLNERFDWILRFIADWKDLPARDRSALVESFTQIGVEFAGSASMVARQLRVSPPS